METTTSKYANPEFDIAGVKFAWLNSYLNSKRLHFSLHGIESTVPLSFFIFFINRGIDRRIERKHYTCDPSIQCLSSRTRDSTFTLQFYCDEALIEISSIPENSCFSFDNIAIIADNLDNHLLFISRSKVIVYKNLCINPDHEFLRKLRFNKANFLSERKRKDKVLLHKDEHGIHYVITQDCLISGESKKAGFNHICYVKFDTVKNEFIRHEFSYSDSSQNNRGKCESTTKATTVRKRGLSNSENYYINWPKRNRHSACPPRPISLCSLRTAGYIKYRQVAAPFCQTSYSNPSLPGSLIVQTSDATAYANGLSYPSGIHSGQSTDELSFFEPRSHGLQYSQQDGRLETRSFCENNHTAYKRFAHSEARKASFTEKWPHPETLQRIENLVHHGFFFTGTEDLVRCFQCGIGLKDWGRFDDPLTEHVRYSPDCQYLTDVIPPTKYKEIKASFLPNNVVSMRESMVSGAAGQTASAGNGATNSDICLPFKPRNPLYTEIAIRKSSFSKWPREITQTPEELAEAGFFYTGCNDIVRCFVCDGGLQKWSPGDSAWVEHARWFPHCAYVRQKKGNDFIELVRLSAEYDQLEEEGPSEGASGYTTSGTDNVTCQINQLNLSEKEPQSAEELVEENEKLRSIVKCHQCQENDVNCLFLPCAHLYYCFLCSAKMKKCPKCKKKIKDKIKTFMS